MSSSSRTSVAVRPSLQRLCVIEMHLRNIFAGATCTSAHAANKRQKGNAQVRGEGQQSGRRGGLWAMTCARHCR